MGIDDKDGNGVHCLVCYKNQVDDVIKALRKKGYTSRTFSYDKIAWEKENEERMILKEQVTNSTTHLKDTAMKAF